MPTYQARPRFLRDYKNLTREQAAAWDSALDLFIACLRRGRLEPDRPSLRCRMMGAAVCTGPGAAVPK